MPRRCATASFERTNIKTFSVAHLFVVVSSLLIPGAVLAERLPIKIYTPADGLAHEQIKRIVRDSRGFLWFCTADGLSRFDGYSFTTYLTRDELPDSVINDLLETRAGEYWVATFGGVSVFNPLLRLGDAAPARFTSFPVGNTPATNRVTALCEDRAGRVWAATEAGLFYLDSAQPRRQFRRAEPGLPAHALASQKVFSPLEDRNGHLWIGTEAGLMERLPDGQMVHHASFPQTEVWSMVCDPDGSIWAGLTSGLLHFDSVRRNPIRLYTAADGLSTHAVRAVFRAGDRQLRVGLNYNGIAALEQDGFRFYNTPRGLPDNGIRGPAKDSAGDAARLSKYGFISFREDDGLRRAFVRSLFVSQSGWVCLIDAPASLHYVDGQLFP